MYLIWRYLELNKNIFSIPRAAEFCSLSRGTIWKYVKSGELKASLTPGRQYRIHNKDLEFFMREKGMYPFAEYQPAQNKILIVDDDPYIQKLLTKMLSAYKYKTEVASDGFEAGVKVMEFKPGLIILDLFMPGMDGFEVCRRIKKNPLSSQIKILAITGYDTKENKDRILEAGGDGYVVKPFVNDELIQKIKDLLGINKNVTKKAGVGQKAGKAGVGPR